MPSWDRYFFSWAHPHRAAALCFCGIYLCATASPFLAFYLFTNIPPSESCLCSIRFYAFVYIPWLKNPLRIDGTARLYYNIINETFDTGVSL